MKKFINLLLSFILALSLFAFTACDDNGNVFEANYKETSVAELASIGAAIDAAEHSDEINFYDGVKLVMDIDVLGSKVEMELKTQKVEAEVLMEGTAKTVTGNSMYSSEIDSKIYYQGGYLYTDYKTTTTISGIVNEQTAKNKQAVELDDYLDNVTELYSIDLDFDDVIDGFENSENVKYYVAKSKSKTNVKVEITNLTKAGSTINGSIVFAFDKDYKLIGFIFDTTTTYGGETYKTYMSFEPWSGTITLPTDLSDYN